MKKVAIGLVVLILLVGVGLYFLYASLDRLVAGAIETAGSNATKTEVSVDAVKIELQQGQAEISGLSVGNPAGFTAPQALKIGRTSVVLDTQNSSTETIVIKEVVIENPEVDYEFGPSGSNFDALKKAVGGSSSGSSGGSSGPKVIIDNLYIRNGKVSVAAPGGLGASANLREIHLTGIGRDQGGASPEEVGRQILSALISGVEGAVSRIDPAKLRDIMDASGVEGAASDLLEGGGRTLDDAAKGAGDTIRGIFGE